MSWYRKYRPTQFSDLVGQGHICTILLSALQKQSPSHAYLFAGPRGTGKTSMARILGKALNCMNVNSEAEPCNDCSHCSEINEGRFVDFIEIDAASNTGVDHIRDLRDKIGFSPTSGKAKVYIIDEVHMLSTGAFNALLKTLEEPPSFVYFILATTELHKVPETIQSRCQRFSFRRLTSIDIVERLKFIAQKENINAEQEALQLIADQSGGGLRDAISLFEQQSVSGAVTTKLLATQMGLVSQTTTKEFFRVVNESDTVGALRILDELIAEGFSLSEFSRNFVLFLRDKLLEHAKNDEPVSAILELVEIFDDAQKKMKFAIIPQLPLEIAIVKATKLTSEKERKEESKGIFGIFGGGDKKSEPKEEKKPEIPDAKKEVKESESAEFIAPQMRLEEIRTLWPQILEKLKNSLLRMSLRNAEILSFEAGVLYLQFPAETWKEKVEDTNNEQEFLAAFQEVFSQRIKVSCSVKNIQLEPIVMEAPEEERKHKTPSPVEMLEEIMGARAIKKEDSSHEL